MTVGGVDAGRFLKLGFLVMPPALILALAGLILVSWRLPGPHDRHAPVSLHHPGGGLRSLGNAMNAQLRGCLVNPWPAATVRFLPVVFVFVRVLVLRPNPLPTRDDVAGLRWWMPLAGITGAVAVFAGLMASGIGLISAF